ncbi:MAG: hypothetical protein EAZ87_15415 [Nostocales cyanobacterium]|nr:MAG: hypothetical protein EAZ87_15415 [Nostocales cyanobacterium]
MFGLDELKQTRYFQDVKEEGKAEGKAEGKLEMIPLLLRLGLSVEAIASELNLDIELIKSRISENNQSMDVKED